MNIQSVINTGEDPVNVSAIPTSLRIFLRAERERRGWSMERLTKEAGLSNKSQVSRIESGDLRSPGWATLRSIADALEVPADVLRQMSQYPSVPMPVPIRDALKRAGAEDAWSGASRGLHVHEELFVDLSDTVSRTQKCMQTTRELLHHPDAAIRKLAISRLVEYLVFQREMVARMEAEAKSAVDALQAAVAREPAEDVHTSIERRIEHSANHNTSDS